MNKKNILNYLKSAAMGFFQGTQERVQNSCDKRAISVRAIKVLLYFGVVSILLVTAHLLHIIRIW